MSQIPSGKSPGVPSVGYSSYEDDSLSIDDSRDSQEIDGSYEDRVEQAQANRQDVIRKMNDIGKQNPPNEKEVMDILSDALKSGDYTDGLSKATQAMGGESSEELSESDSLEFEGMEGLDEELSSTDEGESSLSSEAAISELRSLKSDLQDTDDLDEETIKILTDQIEEAIKDPEYAAEELQSIKDEIDSAKENFKSSQKEKAQSLESEVKNSSINGDKRDDLLDKISKIKGEIEEGSLKGSDLDDQLKALEVECKKEVQHKAAADKFIGTARLVPQKGYGYEHTVRMAGKVEDAVSSQNFKPLNDFLKDMASSSYNLMADGNVNNANNMIQQFMGVIREAAVTEQDFDMMLDAFPTETKKLMMDCLSAEEKDQIGKGKGQFYNTEYTQDATNKYYGTPERCFTRLEQNIKGQKEREEKLEMEIESGFDSSETSAS